MRADPGHAELGQLLDRVVGAPARLGEPHGHGRCGHDGDLLQELEASGGDAGTVRASAGGDLASIADPQAQHLLQVAAVALAEDRDPVGDRGREEPVGVAGHGRTQLGRPAVDHHPLAAAHRLRVEQARRQDHAAAGRAARAAAAAGRARGSRSRAAPAGSGSASTSAWRPQRARRRFGPRSRRPRRPRADRCRSAATTSKPSFAAAIESTPDPQPRSSAGCGVEPLQELERRPRRAVAAGAERPAGVDHDGRGPASAAGAWPRLPAAATTAGRSRCGRRVTGRW